MQCFHNTLSRCSYNVACKCRLNSKCTGVFNTWWRATVSYNQTNLPCTLCDLIKNGSKYYCLQQTVTFWNTKCELLRTLFKDLTHRDPRKLDKNYWRKIQFTFIHNLHSLFITLWWASFRSIFSLLYFSSPLLRILYLSRNSACFCLKISCCFLKPFTLQANQKATWSNQILQFIKKSVPFQAKLYGIKLE